MSNKNRLSVAYPKLCKEWDYEKNGNLRPEDVCYSSVIEVYWKCKEGHSWKESVTSRTGRLNIICDICLSFGFKHPELIKEWHPTKNGKLTPYDARELSAVPVWWICENGHAYKCSPCDRISWARKCFVCRSLEFLNPRLASEWHPTKNGKLKLSDITAGSNQQIWWKGIKCGHVWKATPYERSTNKTNCPFCAGKKACKDNCLATLFPELSKEWHPTKNGDLTPSDFTRGSSKKAKWLCPKCGKEWDAIIKFRVIGQGCPGCSKIQLKDGTICASIPEAYFYLKLKGMGIVFLHNKKYGGLGNCRYDFYIPSSNTYIEITSFSKKSEKGGYIDSWFGYLRNVVKKKHYVISIGANFRFIRIKPSNYQTNYVKLNSK
jgi:hypothetical protein